MYYHHLRVDFGSMQLELASMHSGEGRTELKQEQSTIGHISICIPVTTGPWGYWVTNLPDMKGKAMYIFYKYSYKCHFSVCALMKYELYKLPPTKIHSPENFHGQAHTGQSLRDYTWLGREKYRHISLIKNVFHKLPLMHTCIYLYIETIYRCLLLF